MRNKSLLRVFCIAMCSLLLAGSVNLKAYAEEGEHDGDEIHVNYKDGVVLCYDPDDGDGEWDVDLANGEHWDVDDIVETVVKMQNDQTDIPEPTPAPAVTPEPTPTPAPEPVILPAPHVVFVKEYNQVQNIPANTILSFGYNEWTKPVSTGVYSLGDKDFYQIMDSKKILAKTLGDGVTTLDSEVQVLDLSSIVPKPKEKRETPKAVYDITTAVLSNIPQNSAYSVDKGVTWVNASGQATVMVAAGDSTILVKALGDDMQLESDIQTISVSVRKADMPNAYFDGTRCVLAGLDAGMAVSFDTSSFQTITDKSCTQIMLSDTQLGHALLYGFVSVKRLGNGTTTLDSDIQHVAVAQFVAPGGLKSSPASNGNNGEIKNVDATMQYRKDGSNNWIDIGGSKISGLSSGKYYVRRRASGSTIASNETAITVEKKSNDQSKEATPNADFNAMIMTLSNVRGCRYSTDGGSNYSGTVDSDFVVIPENKLSTNNGIRIYRPGNGSSTTNSDVQTISLSRQSTPSGVAAISATATTLGSIHGVNAAMEYKEASAPSWIAVTGDKIENLKAGNYYIRVRGAYTTLPSQAIAVVISQQSAPAVVKPTVVQATATPAPVANTEQSQKTDTKQSQKTDTKQTDTKKEEKTEESKKDDIKKADDGEKATENTVQTEAATDTSMLTDVADTTAEPVLANAPEEKGWAAIEAHMDEDALMIEMNGSTELPAQVIEAAKQANTELILGMSSDAVWSILPKDIVSATQNIDMGIIEDTSTIPEEILSEVKTKGNVEKTFEVKHEGDFGFKAKLTLKLKENSVGKYAYLLYYNVNTKAMELIDSTLVNEKCQASFQMTHASSYAVVVSEEPLDFAYEKPDEQSGEIETIKVEKKEKAKSATTKMVVIMTVVFIVLAIGGILFYTRQKQAIEDRRRKQAHQNKKK